MADFDLAIIGSGINGAGIARDAVAAGLKVALLEQGSPPALRLPFRSSFTAACAYLEHGALRLVRAALSEREVLLRIAPHLIRPLRFVLPLDSHHRSAAPLRLGLFIYDMIGRREILPPTRSLDLAVDATGVPLRRHFHRGYEYSDCFADDSRLVVLKALDAAERGAVIRTRTRCVRAERGESWQLILDVRGERQVVTARRARGSTPLPKRCCGKDRTDGCTLTRAATSSCRNCTITIALISCKRSTAGLVFTIPFQRDFTLIGTTDQSFAGDPAIVVPTEAEIDYLCSIVSTYFRVSIVTADAVWALPGGNFAYDAIATLVECAL